MAKQNKSRNNRIIIYVIALVICMLSVFFKERAGGSDDYEASSSGQAVTQTEAAAVSETDDFSESESGQEADMAPEASFEENQTDDQTGQAGQNDQISQTGKTGQEASFVENQGDDTQTPDLHFRNKKRLEEHYEKHGRDMGFSSAEEYEQAAAAVVANPDALHKLEKEDGDDVYYVESTNEYVVVSTDGYIRTYFYPDRGKDYFDRQ